MVNLIREAMGLKDQEKGVVIVEWRGINEGEIEKAWQVIKGAEEKRWMVIKEGQKQGVY